MSKLCRLPFLIVLWAAGGVGFGQQVVPTVADSGKPADEAKARAAAIVASAGIRSGLCVQVGCGDGTLTAALTESANFITHAIALDDASLAAARKHLQSAGLYGRASVERIDPRRLPYASRSVNLLVCDDLPAAMKAGLSLKEVRRVLTPGGVAMLAPATDEKTVKSLLDSAGITFELVEIADGWLRLGKGPVPGLGEWTHPDATAEGTWVPEDTVAGPPETLKWIDGPTMYQHHYTRPEAWVSGGGRVFYVFDEKHPRIAGPAEMNLVARDASNGKLLWRKPLPPPGARGWTFRAGTMVVAGDRLYAATGENGALQALDAETGKALVDFKSSYRLVRTSDDVLIASDVIINRLRPEGGKVMWSSSGMDACRRVVLADGDVYTSARRRDPDTRQTEEGLARLDGATGQMKWWQASREPLCFVHRGKVIVANDIKLNNAEDRRITARDAADGKLLWTHTHPCGGKHWFYPIGDRIWCIGEGQSWFGIDMETGMTAATLDGYDEGSITHHFVRCAGTNATARYLVTGNTMDFMDVVTGKHLRSSAARSSCLFGARFGNGMAYAFPVDCGCFKSLRAVIGLAPAETIEPPPADDSPAMVKGPAFGRALVAPAVKAAADWPCYRHDPARSGGSATGVAKEFDLLWKRPVGGALTAPTVAGGLVYVADKDTHTLTAMDAASGEVKWTFTAGGPLDTPPTIADGRCLFGGRDGWVYALTADRGELIWRRRLAPDERRIIAFGRIESPVPVYGSVLAIGDAVYCSAGRTSELDGGVRVVALAAATGEERWRQNVGKAELVGGQVLQQRILSEQGGLGGLLVGDGQYLYMRGWRFDMAGGDKKYYYRWRGVLAGGGKGGLLDETMKQPWSQRTNGQMLVFNDTTTAGFMALKKTNLGWAYFTEPGQGEVTVFAHRFGAEAPKDGAAGPAWKIEACPVAIEAMALAGDTLLFAGPPDEAKPAADAPQPTVGRLWAVSLADGKKLREIDLGVRPVFDGLAVAGGKVYISAADGTVRCFGK